MRSLAAAVPIVLIVLGMFTTAACTGSDATPPSGPGGARATGPNLSPEKKQKLINAAQKTGTLRVVVTLNVPFAAEEEISSEEKMRQQQKIAEAQNKLIEGLKPYKSTVTKKYTETPTIALEVDQAGLKYLLSSPYVAAILRDLPQPAAS